MNAIASWTNDTAPSSSSMKKCDVTKNDVTKNENENANANERENMPTGTNKQVLARPIKAVLAPSPFTNQLPQGYLVPYTVPVGCLPIMVVIQLHHRLR